jgi:outer membrane protein TolC
MSRQAPLIGVALAMVVIALAGCHPQEPFYMKNVDNDFQYYKGQATEIEYPDVNAERLPDVADAKPPFSLRNRDPNNVWELTLEQAIQAALKNNKVLISLGAQQAVPDLILRNPEGVQTTYDPAIVESSPDPHFGTEAALSAFDAQLQASVTWEDTDAPQNVGRDFTAYFPNVSEHDLANSQVRVQKTAVSGGTFALGQTMAYDRDHFLYVNTQGQPVNRLLYQSDWNVKLVAELRQPILQGTGTQFNRIAGPGATPGNFTGVMLARIRSDQALADFEAGVRNFVADVENAYWDLWYAYRALDASVAGRDSALETWRRIYTLYTNGSKGGEAEKEAQARQQYFAFRAGTEAALSGTTLEGEFGVYQAELRLRRLMGLAATDGRLIRPKDEPTTAKVTFDWYEVLAEGLARSVELRKLKWSVKARELELIAAKNFLLPRVDLVGQYRWLGMGNRLDGGNSLDLDPTTVEDVEGNAKTNAFNTLLHGKYQEWQMGVQGQINLGFRREMAGVRNAQLMLARENVRLQEGELELSHQLAWAVRDLETNYSLTGTFFNQRIAAERQVQAVAAAYETDTVTLDVLLQAQRELAEAERSYFRSLKNFNKAITQVHYRKGSLLEYNGVYLAEGPWPGKAYFDARRRSRARAASIPLDYGFTHPKVISRGPIEQHADGPLADGELPTIESGKQDNAPTQAPSNTEVVPVPAPVPISSDEVPSEPSIAGPAPAIVPEPPRPQAASDEGGRTAAPARPGFSPTRATGAAAKKTRGWNPMYTPAESRGARDTAVPTGGKAGNRAGVPAEMPMEPDAGATISPTESSGNGGGWKSAPNRSAARRTDRELLPAGWTVAEKGRSRESGQNSSSPAVDWSASGWKRAER